MRKLSTISDVVKWRLCLGCGACAHLADRKLVEMIDIPHEGLRPRTEPASTQPAHFEVVCPGLGIDHNHHAQRTDLITAAFDSFGPVLEIWEGHAADPEIRFRGSSGGALTALSLHCLQDEGMAGVLQVGQDPSDATRNSTRLSRTREELMTCVGSRYAPASVCERLDLVEEASGPCVVIGQPSEVAALRNLEKVRPQLTAKIGLVLSFFCAGSPPREATLKLLEKLNVPPDDLAGLRYRGHGWPGMFTTSRRSTGAEVEHMTYAESWAFLQKFRPLATHLFPDGSGEGADISCGDPWYRTVTDKEPGSSLIVVRTPRGRDLLQRAMTRGAIVARPASVDQLARSQANLTAKRGAIWGRLLALRMLGIPTPNHQGVSLFANWRKLPLREKLRSVFGTLRRAVERGYRRPQH